MVYYRKYDGYTLKLPSTKLEQAIKQIDTYICMFRELSVASPTFPFTYRTCVVFRGLAGLYVLP